MGRAFATLYDYCCVRSDDLERLVRGAGSGGFNLGTGLVVFDNVPRSSAYPPRPRTAPIMGLQPTAKRRGREDEGL